MKKRCTLLALTVIGITLSACSDDDSSTTIQTIEIDKPTLTLATGRSETLKVIITPENASNKTYTWKSSDTAIATVSEEGIVAAIAVGSTTITATSAIGQKSATCILTVVQKAEVGDFYYTDNTWTTKFNPNKPVLGIVVKVTSDGKSGIIISIDEVHKPWGKYNVDEQAANVEGIRNIGTGVAATRNMILKYKDTPEFTTSYQAFHWIYSVKNQSNIDGRWYLPAWMELNAIGMYLSPINTALSSINNAPLISTEQFGWYWSSTEDAKDGAMRHSFGSSIGNNGRKDAAERVRAYSAF